MRMQITVLLLACTALSAWAGESDSEKKKLKELLDENQNLVTQFARVRKVQKQIADAEVDLAGAQAAVTGKRKDLERRAYGLIEEQQKTEEESRRAGCPWGGSSADAGFVRACNAEAAKLNTRFREIKDRSGSLEEYARALSEEQQALSDRTLRVAKQKRINNSEMELLNLASEDWVHRYNALVFHSEAYEQLKHIESGSRVCEVISRPMTDGALQAAANCLERLWDASR